jgi:predicted phosphodiesterase
MKQPKLILAIFTLLTVALFSFNKREVNVNDIALLNYSSIEELEETSTISFAIFSDNHGNSPYDNIQMAKMNSWMQKSNAEFAIGLGDHIMQQDGRNFLSFIARNHWWYNNFYPTIADSENAYFGKSQDDVDAGGALLTMMNFDKRNDIVKRNMKSEYYAVREVNGYKFHIITLHFPDQPYTDAAFTEESKKFMTNILNGIQKTNKDVVIVNAHSRFGFWIDNLSPSQRATLMNKADLVLSGTTHHFEKYYTSNVKAGQKMPLIINAGSTTNARFGGHNGYVQIDLLPSENALVAQYINLDADHKELASSNESFIKYINGGVKNVMFETLVAMN